MPYTVTEDDLARMRRGYELFNAGEFEALREFLSPDVVMERFDGPPLEGADAVIAFLAPDIFEYQRMFPQETEVHGNKVLIRVEIHSKAVASAIELVITGWQLWTVEDGRVAYIVNSRDEAEARARI